MTTVPVWTFEIKGQDAKAQVAESGTLFDLMAIVCSSWLDDARSGDGGIYDHLWKITHGVQKHIGPHADGFDDDVIAETQESSTKLCELSGLNVGTELKVEYDFGSTTRFSLVAVEKKDLPIEEANKCPRQVVDGTNDTKEIYAPPSDTPSLDNLFPHANGLLFDGIAQWIILFHPGNTYAAVEAGPNAMGDMVFAPHPFASVEEFLVTLDAAATKQAKEGCREDAFSRMVFPPQDMGKEGEEAYSSFKKDRDDLDRAVEAAGGGLMSLSAMSRAGLTEEQIYMMCGPDVAMVRLTPGEMKKRVSSLEKEGFDFEKAFPKTAAAVKRGDWISFRRGVLQLCNGEGEERGVPPSDGVLARFNRSIDSLQELFCLAETYWSGDGEANKKQRTH